jgi:hypothetical protein
MFSEDECNIPRDWSERVGRNTLGAGMQPFEDSRGGKRCVVYVMLRAPVQSSRESIRPDTARHPALTLTLHRRPQRRKTAWPDPCVMKSPQGIARSLGKHFSQSLVADRPANVPGRSVMNVKLRPQQISMWVFFPESDSGESQRVLTPDKAIRIPRPTRQRKQLPSSPPGMKNYQEPDYFCRQTYELLDHPFSNWESHRLCC